jgi:uroporphyrinogen-III synthase
LFQVRPVEWDPPEPSLFDAVMLTSANAAVHAGPPLRRYDALPCYCVGEATGSAAREAGLDRVEVGRSDAAALVETMAAAGVRAALHLCGRDHIRPAGEPLPIERRIVYAADRIDRLAPEALDALAAGALALVHSPRAARQLTELVDEAGLQRSQIRVAAISPACLEALGPGWRQSAAAAVPSDQALLELAAKLCKTDAMRGSDLNE